MNGYREPPSMAVTGIKWLSVMQLIIGILVFIATIVMFATDFRDVVLETKALDFSLPIILAALLCLLGMSAGIAGSQMGQSEGVNQNLSCKTLTMAMSAMTIIAALFYMIVAGTVSFYKIDKEGLDVQTKNFKAAFAMMVVIFIMGFLQLLFAAFTLALCVMWDPNGIKKPRFQEPAYPRAYRDYDDVYVTKRDRMSRKQAPYGMY